MEQPIIVEDLDLQLVKFFCRTLSKIGSSPGVISSDCLERLKEGYSRKTLRATTSTICFRSEDMRVAYIFKYGPCFSGAVSHQFREMLKTNQLLSERIASRDTLVVCCLGGGPATEVVGISKILEEVLKCSSGRQKKPLMVEAIVVDIECGWAETAKELVEELRQLVGPVQVSFSFVRQDITKPPLSVEVENALGRSDVVTMVKVLSAIYGSRNAIYGSRNAVDGTGMLKEIVKCVRDDGLLFLLDSSGFLQYDSLVSDIGNFQGMQLIYQRHRSVHCMSAVSRIYLDHFLPFRGMQSHHLTRTTNNVHAWIKNSSLDVEQHFFKILKELFG